MFRMGVSAGGGAGGFRGRGGGGMFGGSMPRERIDPARRRATMRRIFAFFMPYRLRVAVVLVAIVITSLLGLINPYLLKLLIDEAIPRRDFGLLNLFVALMIAVPIMSGLIGIGQTYLSNVVGQRVMEDLRNALYTHLQRMPLRFFTETRTGEIQSRLANDVGGVQGVVTETAGTVFSNATVILTTVVAMWFVDWRLTLLSLGLLPFFMYLTFRVGEVRRKLSSETQEVMADVSAITEETLSVSGMLLTKTFGQQRTAIDRFRKANSRLAALQIRQSMVGRWFFMLVGTIFSITPAFVYWLAGWLTIQNDPTAPTIGDIVAFTTFQSRLFFPLGQLLGVQVEVQGALALFDRIFEYLEMKSEIVDAPDAVELDPTRVPGHIRYRHVSFRYPASARKVSLDGADGPVDAEALAAVAGAGPDVAALAAEAIESAEGDGRGDGDGRAAGPPPLPFGLEDVDFEAKPGQLVALVGPSGSGKTTTTYLLPRLYDVADGAIEIDGTDVRQIKLASLGQVIGVVTQETYLFHASVRENLRYAKPEATHAELEEAARAAAIHERIMDLPQGYDTLVGERGYKLSGGEKQRVALARVLLKNPRILILDEATSSLDTVSERLIQAALERVLSGRTTVAIAHRLSTILRADLILVYERGRIVERGTHRELLEREGLYSKLYQEQFLSSEVTPEAVPSGSS
jgi:ATP-binding cassette, subfamily B, bacterial